MREYFRLNEIKGITRKWVRNICVRCGEKLIYPQWDDGKCPLCSLTNPNYSNTYEAMVKISYLTREMYCMTGACYGGSGDYVTVSGDVVDYVVDSGFWVAENGKAIYVSDSGKKHFVLGD